MAFEGSAKMMRTTTLNRVRFLAIECGNEIFEVHWTKALLYADFKKIIYWPPNASGRSWGRVLWEWPRFFLLESFFNQNLQSSDSCSCGKIVILSKSPNFLSAIAVIPLTVNKIASSGGLVRYSRRFRYSGRRYSRRYQYLIRKFHFFPRFCQFWYNSKLKSNENIAQHYFRVTFGAKIRHFNCKVTEHWTNACIMTIV